MINITPALYSLGTHHVTLLQIAKIMMTVQNGLTIKGHWMSLTTNIIYMY